MKPVTICLVNMSHIQNTTGVDRYLHILVDGLKRYSWIKIIWINLISDKNLLFLKNENLEHYTKITIPLPQYSIIIKDRYRLGQYNEHIYRLIKPVFTSQENIIFHLHTLNTIDFALYVREKIGCKIITHQHIIPWKELYSKDKNRFNALYEKMYVQSDSMTHEEANKYMINNCELQSYTDADAIICVTRCGAEFLQKIAPITSDKITFIPNGIRDFYPSALNLPIRGNKDGTFHCLFVGAVTENKGIFYLLKALRVVQKRGYPVSLTVAGSYTPAVKNKIAQYNDIKIDLLGQISFEKLQEFYLISDVGIIPSLHEQASYVAIEMSMFGLPLVITAVDGLDEIFTDEINTLKVNTNYSKLMGLTVDVESMANQIIRLINNPDLRNQLGQNVRQLYQENFDLDTMIQKTVKLYEKLMLK